MFKDTFKDPPDTLAESKSSKDVSASRTATAARRTLEEAAGGSWPVVSGHPRVERIRQIEAEVVVENTPSHTWIRKLEGFIETPGV